MQVFHKDRLQTPVTQFFSTLDDQQASTKSRTQNGREIRHHQAIISFQGFQPPLKFRVRDTCFSLSHFRYNIHAPCSYI